MAYSRAALMLGVASIIWSGPALAQQNAPNSTGESERDQAIAPPEEGVDTLLNLPLEDLLALEQTSVAKKRQKVSDAAAAVFVISQDDIRRSAARNIPDLLRMVPGIEVAEIQNGATAVSARGFNSRFSNSLLVMIDGRAIYVSSLSGVLWDQQLLPLDEIERIEVVRGPGATLWGANAVNGVINIISKHSIDTQGVLTDVRFGTRQQKANVAFGGRIGERISYRLSGIIQHDQGLTNKKGHDLTKSGTRGGVGARVDFEPTDQDAITVQTEYSKSNTYTPFNVVRANLLNPGYDTLRTNADGHNFSVLSRWSRRASDTTEFTTQIYYDDVSRKEFAALIKRRMVDFDFGLRWRASETHEFSFGLGGRVSWDHIHSSPAFSFTREKRTDRWLSGYIQDDISLIHDKLRLTIGTKLEVNNITHFEYQPSVRLFFRPSKTLALWGAVSRAVRTPSRFERDSELRFSIEPPGTSRNDSPLPVYNAMYGNSRLKAEHETAYEAGIRGQFAPGWSFDLAAYYNRFHRLASIDLDSVEPLFQAPIPFPVGLNAKLNFGNCAKGRTYGAELAVNGRIRPWWNLNLAYAYLNFRSVVKSTPLSRPLIDPKGSPRNQVSLRQSFDIGESISIDPQIRYVGKLFGGDVPDYVDFDLRASYRVTPTAELSLVGTGLFKKRRLEMAIPGYPAPPAYVPRTLSAQLRVRF